MCTMSHVCRHQWNKVYRRHLRKRAFCSRHPPIVAATAEEDEVVESSLNQRLSGNSSLLTCLRKNHNNRVACSAFLHEGTQEWLAHSYGNFDIILGPLFTLFRGSVRPHTRRVSYSTACHLVGCCVHADGCSRSDDCAVTML